MTRLRFALLVPAIVALGAANTCHADALAFVGMSNGQTAIIDSGPGAIIGTIPAPGAAIALTPDGRRVFLSHSNTSTVRAVDVATKAIIHTFTGLRAPGISVTTDGTRLYAASITDNSVKIFDATTFAPMGTLPVQVAPVCIAMSPNGQLAYVSNFNSGSLSRVDVSTNAIIPGAIAVGGSPAGLVFHPSLPRAYVSNYALNVVQVIDTVSSDVIATIPVGGGPDSIAVTPAGDRVLVANTTGYSVSVIDVGSYSVTATLATAYPGGIGVLADGRAYALCGAAVCVVGGGNTITGTIPLPAYAYTYGDFVGPMVVAPDAPTAVAGTPGNGEALVSFAQGASDGGLAPFSYTVEVSPGGAEVSGAVSPIRVTGLTNGNTYSFRVRATNLVGTSAYSAASTPVSPHSGITADLSITQVATPDPASAGRDLALAMSITNNGAVAATGVTVSNDIVGGMTIVWTSPQCTSYLDAVRCATGTLGGGDTMVLKAVLRPTASGVLDTTASVRHGGSDPVASNDASMISVAVNATPAANLVQRYRLYSDVTKEHHFTTDLNEYTVLGGNGNWVQEGTVGRVLNSPGSFAGVQAVPYYRLYDTATRWHHWTTDANEYYTLSELPNWTAEGVDGYILPTQAPGTIELYRLNYPFLPGLHHWTIDANEYNTLTANFGWVGEPGAGFVIP